MLLQQIRNIFTDIGEAPGPVMSANLPLRAVLPEVRRGPLHFVRISCEKLILVIGLVFHKSDYQPQAVSKLIELFHSNR